MKLFSIVCLCTFLLVGSGQARTFGKGAFISHELPPVRLQTLPDFVVPVPGDRHHSSLDEGWQMMQILYDADTTWANYRQFLNAVPVQIGFPQAGDGFLATLHTVFETTDRGRTWRNLDPHPQPGPGFTEWLPMRSPMFISGLSARRTKRTQASADTVLISAYSSDADTSNVRLLYYSGAHHLFPFIQISTPVWLTGVMIPDTFSALAFGGLNGRLWRNDSLALSYNWNEQDPDKIFLRSGRADSLLPTQTWVAGTACAGSLAMAVGSHQWVSHDFGAHWHIRPASDSLFDYAVSFCDSLHGMTGAGTLAPTSQGWVHVTTDGGATWSGRVLETNYPIRAVLMVTPQVGYAAGGDYTHAHGDVWSTRDGGQTWTHDLVSAAEIRALACVRANSAYVNVIAAGVLPDFRGIVYRNQLYLPDTTAAALIAEPDTLDFGQVSPGAHDTLTVMLHNIGTVADTIIGITGISSGFAPLWSADSVGVAPGQQVPLRVVFSSSVQGAHSCYLQILNQRTGFMEVLCRADVSLAASPEESALLPGKPALTVWPNPGNASFEIRYELARAGNISLRIFDLNGRLVETLAKTQVMPGEHVQTWNAARHSSGIYFVRLDMEDSAVAKKILLIK
jgi:photosystem II stability/assembly factor-like uncharacterized protein